jgi:hypothetical protein
MIDDIAKIMQLAFNRIDAIEDKLKSSNESIRALQIDELTSLRTNINQLLLITQTALNEHFKTKVG